MPIKKKIIDGYLVEVDVDLNRDGSIATTGCWVRAGNYGSSLNLLDHLGHLEYDGHDPNKPGELPVRRRTIDKISEWAEANGY